MRDRDIRHRLHEQLQAKFGTDPDTRILDEMGLCQGSVRVDVAVINGVLHGYEIKSERDTLERLPAQQVAYSRVFDRVTLVVGGAHADRACEVIPDWWEIQHASQHRGSVKLTRARSGKRNPNVDAAALVQLLWRDEALSILEELGMASGLRTRPRRLIWDRLAVAVPLSELQHRVRQILKVRDWRGREQ